MTWQPPTPEDLIQADLSADAFNDRALALLRGQAQHNPVWNRFLQGAAPDWESFSDWRDFPALPVAAFREAMVTCYPGVRPAMTFSTSGTTGGETGCHPMAATAHYERALRLGFSSSIGANGFPRQWVSLIPSWADRPEGSLNYMISHLARELGVKLEVCCGSDQLPDLGGLVNAVRNVAEPVLLIGTGFAWVQLLDYLEGRDLACPDGSMVFETGGTKGRTRKVSRAELTRSLAQALNLPATAIWNEYGMTELSSQCYARGDQAQHQSPPWMQVRVIDPLTGTDAAQGEVGLLHFMDLANVHGVAAVATQDCGRKSGAGIELLGRAPQARLRGCSLPFEPGRRGQE